MLKFAVILILIVVLFRWALGYWPWELAKGPDPHGRKVQAARRLLGVTARADRTEILAAHKLLLTRVHPDRGGTSERVHAANDARDLLLKELGERLPEANVETTDTKPEDEGSDQT